MISVLIPCYNAEKFVSSAVKSILDQTYKDLELVIIDDASTDRSLEILKSFSDERIRLLYNSVNLGYLKTMNKLFKEARGEILAFQDSDDLSHPERLERQIAYLHRHPEVAGVGTNFSVLDEKDHFVYSSEVLSDPEDLSEELPKRNPFQKPSIMFHRAVYEKIGGFREEFLVLKNISEDYDWLLRASHHFKLGNINHSPPLYQYRSVADAMTKGFRHLDQLLGAQVSQYLYQQRLMTGTDAIDSGNLKPIYQYIEKLKEPYKKDPSRFFRERAEALVYSGLKKQAIGFAWQAFCCRRTIYNLRLVQHCLRKYLLGV